MRTTVPPRRRRWRWLLALPGTAFALVLLELAFRTCGPESFAGPRVLYPDGTEVPADRLWQPPDGEQRAATFGGLRPGVRYVIEYSRPGWSLTGPPRTELTVNSLGLRDEEFAVGKATDELRVLAIGDSWTFGVGVPGPMTWPEVLEDLLRARRRGPVQVVNAGVATGHQSPDGYDRWFADRGSALDPDLVVVGFSLNDLGPVPMLSYQPVPKEPILGGWSRFLDHVVWRVRQRRAREAPRDHLLPFLELARQFEQWQQTQRGLRALRQIADERGITLVVAVFPMLTELERYPYGRLHDIVDEFCAAEGIRCVDLRDRFLGRVDEDLWVHPADPHPNRLGHRLLAEGIDEFLQREGLDRAGR